MTLPMIAMPAALAPLQSSSESPASPGSANTGFAQLLQQFNLGLPTPADVTTPTLATLLNTLTNAAPLHTQAPLSPTTVPAEPNADGLQALLVLLQQGTQLGVLNHIDPSDDDIGDDGLDFDVSTEDEDLLDPLAALVNPLPLDAPPPSLSDAADLRPSPAPGEPLQPVTLELRTATMQPETMTTATAAITAAVPAQPAPLIASSPLAIPVLTMSDEAVVQGVEGVALAEGNRPVSTAAAPLNQTQPTLPTSTIRMHEALDSSTWRGEFNQQVAQVMLKQGDQRMLLQLHPADLGALTVEVRMRDGHADLQFLSPHLQVRSAVSDALPQLRDALSQQGISLGQADVGEHQESGRWQRHDEETQRRTFNDAELVAEIAAPSHVSPDSTAAAGRVNLYV